MSDDIHKYPSDEAERFQIRMPPGLRDRIKDAASKNNRSMNAEILSTLERAYPPRSIDIEELSEFLESLIGVSAPDGNKKYRQVVMEALSKTPMGWSIESGWDGMVSFVPHVNHAAPDSPNTPPKKRAKPT